MQIYNKQKYHSFLGRNSIMSDTQILLYNFEDPERLRSIRRYLLSQKITFQIVQPPEYWEPLGYLFHLPGFTRNSTFHLGGNFHDEMMVLHHFSQEQLDSFLAFFRNSHLKPVALKAVLTPVTQHWNSIKLYEELSKEHQFYHPDH